MILAGWKWHMARWHYFTYDQDENSGGSACGKYGLRMLGRSRTPRKLTEKRPPEGESVCEQCKQRMKDGAIW
jgi:hypothetical protein